MVLVGKCLKWQFEIGDKIQDDKRDFTIIDRRIMPSKYKKGDKIYILQNQLYVCKCNKCGYESEKYLCNIKKGSGCVYCAGFIACKGVNDIATLRPDLLDYFVDINDAYNNTIRSGKRIKCRCPICGHEKEILISNLSKTGLSCNYCSDGISYPEKFMNELLSQLNINYERQYKINKYKYDFYLLDYNTVIETNGEQHYTNTFMNKKLSEEKENDDIKKKLAKENGLIYVEIDCSKSEMEYIKKSIENNNFFKSNFNLGIIDWNKCNLSALKNKLIEVCEFWKNNCDDYTVNEMADKFRLGYSTILKYLHIGNDVGLCHFDKKIENKMGKDEVVKTILYMVKRLQKLKGKSY